MSTVMVRANCGKGDHVLEYFGHIDDKYHAGQIREFAAQAVRHWGLTAPFNSSERVSVMVDKAGVVEGRLSYRLVHSCDVLLPNREPSTEQFAAAMNAALIEVPAEIADVISRRAYESGHSAGHAEVLNIARSMAADFAPACKALILRLTDTKPEHGGAKSKTKLDKQAPAS